ncbi:PREDICTED: putative late blight resistance protein homolog R1A-10 isoform X2 [Ipomoea nil]|uniref:putative late blight resistance protein homolog R1A-10 isoform X2 n=1 Tax=Ipomoea nil TaxID=35883 RepID=UPI0009009295|nr:PREDICTED: putative late blight resistance protein homolog R1A-10 isoform X2 [Ipomoea nil]
MACVALASLIGTIEIEFVQPTPRVRLSPHDSPLIISIIENLSCLQAFLQKKSSGDGDGDALRELEIQIRDFAIKAEDDIELQLSNILHAEDRREYREKASDELHQTLEEAAKNATKLLESCGNSISGAAIKKLETKIRIFALEAEHDLEIQLSNFLQAKHTSKEESNSQKLHQTLGKAAEIAAKLFQIIDREKEHEKEREVNCDALASLRKTIDKMELSMTSLHDKDKNKAGIKSNLLEKLSSLQLFLHKESNGGGGGGGGGGDGMKDLETIVENFALKARHDINLQLNSLLQAKDTEFEEKVSQELHLTMQEVAETVAELLNTINCRRSNEVDDDEANETQPWLKHSADASKYDGSSLHGFLKPEGRMVGRLHDNRVIKNQLISFQFGLKIISIVGMVGIGKTTLARYVYDDASVASYFDVRSWVTIPPQHYNKRRILIQLLKSIKPEEPNIIKKGSTPVELQMQVRNCLRGRKYLIVLDNIMSGEAYTDIINLVPDDKVGSRILQTTRHFDQHTNGKMYVHHMMLLDPKESWELFGNILSIEEHLAPKFEKIRNHVVEKCDGLPQLIVEVAKRLSKCNNIKQGWKKIEKELESLGLLDRNALSVSYNMLPHHLKVCFLYFGVFPKRKKILVKMLIRLWIAEGFVTLLKHKELEDEAYEYLQELTDTSLLLIEDQSCNDKIKTCRMHSAMHSFCVVEAQKEGILCAVNTQQHLGLSLKAFANSCRWLSLYSHSFDYYVLFGTNIPRSIFFFHDNPEMFVPPKLLRVLAFDTSISFQRVPVQLGGLVFLRYLSITQWFKDLDDVVSNNPNLETLVVSGNGAPTVHLPSNIWKPPQLKHLELGNSYMVYPPSADKKEFKTLSWVVRPVHCRKKMYSKFPNIKNLKILLKDDIEPPSHIGGCCSNPIISDHFYYLEGLEKLSISVSIGCSAALPKQCMYPLGLKELKLSGTYISASDLNVTKLPELKVLKLENAFHGTVWNVARGGFPKLISLLLEAKELKQWVLSNPGDLWELRHLVLRSCNCLEQMPKCQGYKLKSIELKGCHSSLVTSAKQFQQDFKYRNIEIKILDPEYDKSQNTDAEVSM